MVGWILFTLSLMLLLFDIIYVYISVFKILN